MRRRRLQDSTKHPYIRTQSAYSYSSDCFIYLYQGFGSLYEIVETWGLRHRPGNFHSRKPIYMNIKGMVATAIGRLCVAFLALLRD